MKINYGKFSNTKIIMFSFGLSLLLMFIFTCICKFILNNLNISNNSYHIIQFLIIIILVLLSRIFIEITNKTSFGGNE